MSSRVPEVPSEGRVKELLMDWFGLHVDKVALLGSCQDMNFKVKSTAGDSYVFKISNSATSAADIEFQNRVMKFVSESKSFNGKLSTPVLQQEIKTNSLYGQIEMEGERHFIRLQSFVHGSMLSEYHYLSRTVLLGLGRTIAEMCEALSSFDGKKSKDGGEVGPMQWDLKHSRSVISSKLAAVCDLSRRDRIQSLADEAWKHLLPHITGIREQVIHADLALYNIVATRGVDGRPRITGVIDFCDTMDSWVVSDLAVAMVSSFGSCESPDHLLLYACHILKGYTDVSSLNESEVMSLWPLVLLRSMVNIVSIEHEVSLDSTNEYNVKGLRFEHHVFDKLLQVPIKIAMEAFRQVAGLPPSPEALRASAAASGETRSMLGDVLEPYQIDLSPVSDELIEGNWLDASTMNQFIKSKCDANLTSCVLIGSYGVPRLSDTVLRAREEPPVVPLATTVCAPAGSTLRSPVDSTAYIVTVACETLILLRAEEFDIIVRSDKSLCLMDKLIGACSDGTRCVALSAGDQFASTDPLNSSILTVQVSVLTAQVKVIDSIAFREALPPLKCRSSLFCFWSLLVPDPLQLLCGQSFAQSTMHSSYPDMVRPGTALETRKRFVASPQEHYFSSRPPNIERGWQQFMYDIGGRSYLDMVNNVTVLGHCHPAVRAAATKQLSLLNTNSRFIYSLLGRFAEKIVGTMGPDQDKLNTVFFVNSGSEATDLALRLARTVVSERRKQSGVIDASSFSRDVICLEGAYHGVTTASDEVSTTLNDNPRARETRPAWIHTVPMPNMSTGKYTPLNTGIDDTIRIGELYASCVDEKVDELCARGSPPAAFIAEPLSGNAGGVEIPFGYLKRVYEKVRSVGGLCIADEVQVGYGRLGNVFWGYREHGIVPDILTMAKASGNGHPVGFVVTSREIADEFGADGSFFSSVGGGPVSCAVGIAVLDTVIGEELQQNALTTGAYMKEKLLALAEKHSHIIGCIHGHGLYMGVELSVDAGGDTPGRRRPATAEAYAICERMLELGIICHNTGDYSNVLKIKPPLCFNREDADYFVSVLDQICSEGW